MTAEPATALREQVEAFLFEEAALLDDWRLDDWVALFTDDGRYVVPTTDLPEGIPHVTRSSLTTTPPRVDSRADHRVGHPYMFG